MKQRTGTVNCMIVTLILCIIAELIGPLQFKVMGVDVKILTMIWVIIMGILLSPSLLGKVIPPLKKVIGHAEISRAPYLLSLTLYPLGIMSVSVQDRRSESCFRQVRLCCCRSWVTWQLC